MRGWSGRIRSAAPSTTAAASLSTPATRRVARRSHTPSMRGRNRLGPDHPAPAAVEDAYAALRGLAERAGDLHNDIDRIAIGGASAGGGIAAAPALLAHDRAEIRPVFQLLRVTPPPFVLAAGLPGLPSSGTGVWPLSCSRWQSGVMGCGR
ncbi:alpha/beta hydrolase fold domain-containing protein [Streptomyces sp. URMC 128]|uniref:alpha/beta hydrolase fold domain-containing protein n=1 Tax=Streptomyces sp. URMC 128 TaxID=3423404 RepID=UPI003F1D144B